MRGVRGIGREGRDLGDRASDVDFGRDVNVHFFFAAGFFFGGSDAASVRAVSTHFLAFRAVQSLGNVTYPPMGRSSGPNGPAPSAFNSLARASSGSFTPMSAPKRPMNMLPFTNAPRFPNIGFTSTPGAVGTNDSNRVLSASLGFGIFTSSLPAPAEARSSPILRCACRPPTPGYPSGATS